MFYAYRRTLLLCLGVLTFYNERIKTMNQKEVTKTAGQFSAYDKQGVPVIIEWQKTTLFAPEFAAAMKEAWDVAALAYTPVEMQFLRTYPEVVGAEDYFKPFESLFKNGLDAVDWAKATEVMQTLLKSHFIFDASTWGAEVTAMYAKDVCYVVTIRDQQTKALRGFCTFMIRPNYTQGDIKVMSFAVDPAYQNRGLGKLLISSILKINPSIKRIFMCTRVTNRLVLIGSPFLGFTKDTTPILEHAFNLKHWIFFEYKTAQTDVLQKIAAGLVEVK